MTDDIIARLAERGVTPEQALRDIEKSPDYVKIIASEDGQRLLKVLALRAAIARGVEDRTSYELEETE